MRTLKTSQPGDRYFSLVRAFPLRRIRSGAEHRKATLIYLRLSQEKPDAGTRQYRDVLADLIADYEKRSGQTIDATGVSAAELVRHRLEERGMSLSELARQVDLPQSNLSQMLSGRREWSKSAIVALSKFFNIRAERFLN